MKQDSGSMVSTKWVDFSVKALKLLAYILVFAIVLISAVVSKGTLLFITSQLKKDKQVVHCNRLLGLFFNRFFPCPRTKVQNCL